MFLNKFILIYLLKHRQIFQLIKHDNNLRFIILYVVVRIGCNVQFIVLK